MTRHLDIDERDWIDFYLNLTLNAAFFLFECSCLNLLTFKQKTTLSERKKKKRTLNKKLFLL